MLKIVAEQAGGPEVLRVVEAGTPTPGPGEVLVRHEAVGLNYIDTYHRGGLYPMPFPMTPGVEAAGVIAAVGEGVSGWAEGDRVGYAVGGVGAYAAARTLRPDKLLRLPDGVTAEQAAASLLKGMTAEMLLRRVHPVAAGEAVLVHAAAGGVGQILVQWAKALGATVIATAGGPEKLAVAQRLGADHLIDYRDEDVAARVREITGGQGVRVAYDGVGKATAQGSLKSLGRRGMLALYGNASGPADPVSPLDLMRGGSLFLTRPGLFDYTATRPELEASAAALFAVLESGAVQVEVGARYPLAEAARAHADLEARRTTGSVLLIP